MAILLQSLLDFHFNIQQQDKHHLNFLRQETAQFYSFTFYGSVELSKTKHNSKPAHTMGKTTTKIGVVTIFSILVLRTYGVQCQVWCLIVSIPDL